MTTLSCAAPSSGIADVAQPYRAGPALDAESFADVRREMVLRNCKWDPQVGDTSTLAPFALILHATEWKKLASWSESLAAEALAAERELLTRPDLHKRLALPRALRRALHNADQTERPPGPRVMRFDFHWTRTGWRISEVNADVPGGYTEAGSFTALMSRHCAQAEPAGDPAARIVEQLQASIRHAGTVALLVAPGFMEDYQVVSYLAYRLCNAGLSADVIGPRQLAAELRSSRRADAIIRFYQAEWLARLPRRVRWRDWLCDAHFTVTNPLSAALTESKRFPLVWDELATPLPTWRRLLPRTHDPRAIEWQRDERWLLKTAFCNTGDTVVVPTQLPDARALRRIVRDVWLRPTGWIAQERFEAVSIASPLGLVYPCIGVYVVDGNAAGMYGRISRRKIIDFAAMDIAVLVEPAREEAE